jgi:hypothetical protein
LNHFNLLQRRHKLTQVYFPSALGLWRDDFFEIPTVFAGKIAGFPPTLSFFYGFSAKQAGPFEEFSAQSLRRHACG